MKSRRPVGFGRTAPLRRFCIVCGYRRLVLYSASSFYPAEPRSVFMRSASFRLIAVVEVLLLLGSASCWLADASAQTEMVAMSDGVKLATDVYLPADAKP